MQDRSIASDSVAPGRRERKKITGANLALSRRSQVREREGTREREREREREQEREREGTRESIKGHWNVFVLTPITMEL